ncbi:protein mono-ADP-ribosyltransferase PARP4 [Cebus imitator]|uniref:Poly [ADP-ribose] polymerase n=1 Tax=Cebus imitator TaxID=2715852 RepID=A0A2K5RNC5_CEBIM|nr:protein mono-ADP-ribosyltransferase PARP4 [Cebus imitator]
MMMGIFANCNFCLKVKYLPRQQKKKLQADIKENGGKFSFSLNPQCTHVILDNADVLSQYQLNSIQKNHVHIANPDFIWESIREKRLLDVKNYDPNKPLDVTPPPDQKASSPEAKTEDVCLDSATEEEDTMELNEFSAESVEISHLPQDFEVAKYNTLEKVGMEGGREAVVVELQCSRDSRDCPFLISSHFLLADGMQTRRQFAIKKTSEDASEYYENYIEELKKQGFLLREHFTPEATQLASEQLQALLLEEVMNSSTQSQEVSDLVEMIWAEALGHLEHTLLKPVSSISLNDVSKAEGVLLLVKAALKNGETAEQLQKMMTEFYRLIPHKGTMPKEVNLGLLAKKADLCQLIRDMVNVCETNLSKPNPPSLAKYRALRCKIEHVEKNTEEFLRVRQEVLQNNHSKSPVDILQIFRVGRVNETTEFLSKLGNVRPLLHGSPVRNIVGILCRGLLLPKVVEDRGVQRTDVGNLGSGIYFSDSLSTSIKYSHPGETEGTRLLLICDVALGKCMDLHKKDFSLTEAPPGYDSVHGVSQTASVTTDFEDDEFVVYKTNQVKMKYIIKFSMPGDQIKNFHPGDHTELEEYRPEFSDFSKVEDYQLPDAKTSSSSSTKAGLQDASGNLVPLEDVHIKGRIIDIVAQVIVFQTYTNNSHVPIEAKYIFPLDDKAAVCGFEAFINGKHIVGEIKEKEEAQREYREAVSRGDGAYLMSQDAPDVFTVSVGNLPPKAKVLIKITYITELSILGTVGVFFMPATVAPWQQDKALNENLQDTVQKICIKEIGTKQSFSLTMSIEMPYVIEFIFSDTHELKQKCTDCKAVISTMEGSSLDSSGFSLHIGLSDAYLPRMWVEKHPEKESEACMLVFQPDLSVDVPDLADESEVIICLDCSSSMEGVTFLQAKQIALHALSLVGEKQKVNIIQFGTGSKELFSYPKHITSNTAATEFIMSATPTMGNTDFWKTLRYLSLLYPARGSRSILLVSDGHLQDESLTLQLVKRGRPHTRLFACGIGSTANRHTLRILSQYGAGVFEYFNAKSKHSWRKQIEDQMTRLCSPSCHAVSVKWQQLNPDAPEALQAPAQVPSLFCNDRLLVYGFIPHCTQATLCALIQEKEFSTMVSTTELQKTTGTMIHKLAARALIRDYEDGILHENETSHEMKKHTLKSLIIKLSKENSLITQFTSFVAVEKRDEKESPFSDIPKVSELIAKEDVDFLPYMNWQGEPQEAVMDQPLLASSEWQEVFSCKRKKCSSKRKMKLSKSQVSEDFEKDGLAVVQGFASNVEHGDEEKLLDLSWTPSLKPAATEPLFKKVSSLQTSPSSLFGFSAPVCGSSFFQAARSHSPASMPLASFPQLPSLGFAAPPRQFDASEFRNGPVARSGADCIPQSLSCPIGPPQNPPFQPFCGLPRRRSSLLSTQSAPLKPLGGLMTRPLSGTFPELDSPQLHSSLPTDPGPIKGFGSYQPSVSSPFHLQPSPASLSTTDGLPVVVPQARYHLSSADLSVQDKSVGSLEGSQWLDFCFQSSETFESVELSEEPTSCGYLQILSDTTVDSTPCLLEGIEEDEIVCTQRWLDAVPWTELLGLQTEDGFWKLTPELGFILNLNTNALHSFLQEKGIQSLGVKGREHLLDLIATMLVLQFICTRLEKEGIVFKSLMKLDDASVFRNIPWAFEAIEKASEWVRRTEGQYPSICPRLELGKDWDSATKQLLGLQPINTASPLHRVLHYSQG